MREVQGWIVVDVVEEAVRKAKAIRTARSHLYDNPNSKPSAWFWVGDLGEVYVDRWLRYEGVCDYEWFVNDPVGKPDFQVGPVSVDVKTVKRQRPPHADYSAHVRADQIGHEFDQYFFCCYSISTNEMWLLGGITRPEFLAQARLYHRGEWVHQHYQVPDELYNIGLGCLKRPRDWLLNLVLPP